MPGAVNASGRQFHTSDRTERYVSARMNRQTRLTDPNPLGLHALIDELVVRRIVGGCVELAHTFEELRDSKNPAGPTLHVDLASLLDAVKAGQLHR